MEKQKGSCHCGKVKFEAEVDVTQGLACNCSMCGRKGTLLGFIGNDQFKMISGEQDLTDYQFGKKKIHHTFCSTCGVTAFATGIAPDGKVMKAVNLRCIEGIDLEQIKVQQYNGKDI